MNIFKINGLGKAFYATLLFVLLNSCNEEKFLDVPPQDRLSADNFLLKPEDFDYLLNDLYGRLRNTLYSTNNFTRVAMLRSHEADQAYAGVEFNVLANNSLISSTGDVRDLWNSLYENVAKCNAFMDGATKYRERNPDLASSLVTEIDRKEGQARFIRALNYFQLITLFGETFIVSPGDENKMGVPLLTKVASSIEETNNPRATIGEVYNFIIEDLLAAEGFLKGVVWAGDFKGRVGSFGVKGLLGKVYLYSAQYQKAAEKLKEVIDNSGKTLVDYSVYRNMFSGQNEFNSESIFEFNYNENENGNWNNAQQTSTFISVIIGMPYLNNDRKLGKNGFANLYVHDRNLARYGYNYDKVDESKLKDGDKWKDDGTVKGVLGDYLSHAAEIRKNKTVDPRLFVSALQPYYDSILLDNKKRPVLRNPGEGINLTNSYAWSIRKAGALERNANSATGPNIYVIRLADIYLMYAESLIKSGGSTETALEYINKVKRRAYSLPVNTPSAIDYQTLSDKTTAPDFVLGNNPLKYERWAEFLFEGQWWFDVARWKIGSQEAAYYQQVGSGQLVWDDKAYAMPIPESEINANSALAGQQNPGY